VAACQSDAQCPPDSRCSVDGRCVAVGDAGGLDGAPIDAGDSGFDARDAVLGDLPIPGDVGADNATDALPDTGGDGGAAIPPFAGLCAGSNFTCGLSRSGEVWCWGTNTSGVLGRGSTMLSSSRVPAPVVGIADAVGIACHDAANVMTSSGPHACALLRDATVWCWGDNNRGQLGVPAMPTPSSATPLRIPGVTDAVAVALGAGYGCVLNRLARVSCWGVVPNLLLGAGMAGSPTPTLVPVGEPVGQLAVGGVHTCVRGLTSGNILCWGYDIFDGFGDGAPMTTAAFPTLIEFATLPMASVALLGIGGGTTCAVTSAAEPYCWGANARGAAGIPPFSGTVASPTLVPGVGTVRAISTGLDSSCAILTDRTVRCWGDNGVGQRGDGTTGGARGLGGVVAVRDVVGIDVGQTHACAITSDGTAWCWGEAANGQLGPGTMASIVNAPVRVAF